MFNKLIKKDEMSGKILYGDNPPWYPLQTRAKKGDEILESDILLFISYFEQIGYSFEKNKMWELINTVANSPSNSFHPLRDYLNGLQWDGINRAADTLFTYGGVVPMDNDHKRILQLQWKTWLVGAIQRVYEPGCKFDVCFVLDGVQYLGKSAFWKILAGEKFFSDTPVDLTSKDAYLVIQGIWIYELAELEAFGKADVNRQKSFLSSTTDRVRVPYSIKPIDFPRTTAIVGTTNEEEYLKDPTGNRRFFTATVSEEVNQEAMRRDRDQILAEAITWYRAGVKNWLSFDDMAAVEAYNARKAPQDHLKQPISEWLDKNSKARITLNDIMDALSLSTSQRTRSIQVRIGIILSGFGYKKHDGGKVGNFYTMPGAPKRVPTLNLAELNTYDVPN